MSRARLTGPTEARMLALAEDIAQAVSDRFGASRRSRGLLALVQEHDGDLHEIHVELHGRIARSGKRFGAGITLTIPEIGIDRPGVAVTVTSRAKAPPARKRKRRPAA